MRGRRTPSRVLNDAGKLLGIQLEDALSLVVVFFILQWVLFFFEKEAYALLMVIASLIALVPIRLNNRRHIIRDVFGYLWRRFLYWGNLHA